MDGRTIPIIAFCLACASAQAADWYVKPSSAGSNNGTSWLNAWSLSSLNWSSIQPGDRIWLAGGSYSSTIVFGKGGALGQPITIRRVTSGVVPEDAVATSSPGYSSSFNSVAVIPQGVSFGAQSYVTLDGGVDDGIQMTVNTGGVGVYWGPRGVSLSVTHQDNVQLSHVTIFGPMSNGQAGCSGSANCGYGIYADYSIPIQINNPLISHVTINGMAEGVDIQNWNNGVIEYSKIMNLLSVGQHPDIVFMWSVNGLAFRYNYTYNSKSEGIFMENAGPFSGVYIYGNTFVRGPAGSGICLMLGLSDVHLYNNNFIGWSDSSALKLNLLKTPSEVYNNIFLNSNVGTTDAASTGNNYVTTTDPFVNSAGNDFHLKGGSPEINAGRALVSDGFINKDPDGNIRGADGAWDIGGYEYTGGGVSTNPVAQASPTTLTFGAVSAAGATNTFTIQNSGSGTLNGTASVAASAGSFLTIISGGTYSLGAGQSQVVAVRYIPTGASSDTGIISCSGGGGAQVTATGSLVAVLPGLSFPSYAGNVTAPFTTNGGVLSQTVDVSNSGAAGISAGGRAVYTFNIASAGSYIVSASVNAPNASSKSFWVNVDAQPTDPTMIWDIYPYTSGFQTRAVSWRGNGTPTTDQFNPQVFNLSAGTHQLIIVGREANVQLGQITISPSGAATPTPPSNLHIIAGP